MIHMMRPHRSSPRILDIEYEVFFFFIICSLKMLEQNKINTKHIRVLEYALNCVMNPTAVAHVLVYFLVSYEPGVCFDFARMRLFYPRHAIPRPPLAQKLGTRVRAPRSPLRPPASAWG